MPMVRKGAGMVAALVVGLFLMRAADQPTHLIRATGTIQATHSLMVQAPVMQEQGGQLTLIKLVQNGTRVHQGDLLA